MLALFLLGAGGLLTLLTRTTPVYGLVLALHLATVFACFVLAPFTKFTHALYRLLALVSRRARTKPRAGCARALDRTFTSAISPTASLALASTGSAIDRALPAPR